MRSTVRVLVIVSSVLLGLVPTFLGPARARAHGRRGRAGRGDADRRDARGFGDLRRGRRWAGNTNRSSSRVDALGPTAYWETVTGEAIGGCHRSKAAQAHIGDGVASANLACSGARTYTTGTRSGQTFKPGIDFYSDTSAARARPPPCGSTLAPTTSVPWSS